MRGRRSRCCGPGRCNGERQRPREPSAAALSNEQLRQLAQLLARKVWVRRQELGATSRRLTSVLLDQTAQRVLQGRQTT